MPYLIPLIIDIAAAIAAAVAIVASVVITIVEIVVVAIAAVAVVLINIAVTIVESVVIGLTWVSGYVWQQVGWLVNWVIHEAGIAAMYLADAVATVGSVFSEILAVIHFKLIMEVHQIVYLISPQYRAMMKKVYAAISEVSQALGLGPQFLSLALQNTRNLVLSTSTLFGKRYDLAQVTWLGTLSNYLDHFNKYAETYRNNPEQVFWDLANMIERPTMDGGGAWQQSIVTGLETALDFATHVGQGFLQIGIDVETLYDDLPEWVKKQIPDPGESFWKEFQPFLNDWYLPTVGGLTTAVGEWSGRLATAQADVSQLVIDLRKPGTIMTKIDDLPTGERLIEENFLAEYSNRKLNRLLTSLQPVFDFAETQLDVAARIVIPPPAPLPIMSYEPVGAVITPPGAMVPRSTWFVGDY